MLRARVAIRPKSFTKKLVVTCVGGNDTLTGGLDADAFIGEAGRDTATDYTPAQGDTKSSVEVF